MFHRSTADVVRDLQQDHRLIEVDEEVSPHLEIAEIQRRVYLNQGPAILFRRPQGCRFPMLANMFGSLDQARFLFRHTLERVRRAIELKIEPSKLIKSPMRYWSSPWVGWTMMPRRVHRAPVLANQMTLEELPSLKSWPDDGGPFVTLPQVLSQAPTAQGLRGTNLGMYRVQLAGNEYDPSSEVGLHYQIHRGIGVHHEEAIRLNRPLRVNITVGGTPAMTLAAVMPLPEGMSELTFAGALAGHRIPMMITDDQAPIYADADFCITGEVALNDLKPEGPFGDHLGYYSLQHPFPYLRVKQVTHRPDAIWPFTVVGRPPQEDTTFGELIHELTGPILPTVLPGVQAVHAVDAAGVHPLLLAIGTERYTPYRKPSHPQELMTQAHAILGQGQLSLAKYLCILDQACDSSLDIHDIEKFFRTFLERIDFENGLHFITRTTMDTLDYSGEGWNYGSKLIAAATGSKRRDLTTNIPNLDPLANHFGRPHLCFPGVFTIEPTNDSNGLDQLRYDLEKQSNLEGVAIITLVDDARTTAANLRNWLWTTFTRSNPAKDIDGVGAFQKDKHWGCRGPLLIDARRKPHHAPPLVEDPQVTAKIDAMASKGGPLAKYL